MRWTNFLRIWQLVEREGSSSPCPRYPRLTGWRGCSARRWCCVLRMTLVLLRSSVGHADPVSAAVLLRAHTRCHPRAGGDRLARPGEVRLLAEGDERREDARGVIPSPLRKNVSLPNNPRNALRVHFGRVHNWTGGRCTCTGAVYLHQRRLSLHLFGARRSGDRGAKTRRGWRQLMCQPAATPDESQPTNTHPGWPPMRSTRRPRRRSSRATRSGLLCGGIVAGSGASEFPEASEASTIAPRGHVGDVLVVPPDLINPCCTTVGCVCSTSR